VATTVHVAVDAMTVRVGPRGLAGTLACPGGARGVVLFAHGSGSSRFSPRNRSVADALHRHRLATLLFDLLDDDEAQDRRRVFDIELLATRLREAIDWLASDDAPRLPGAIGRAGVGLFGASTGAAAALRAAAAQPDRVAAVVSRGGRADLAGDALTGVRAPTLLIVGGDDTEVLALNRAALAELRCEKRLEVIPGATHLFEEPGTLDAVARLAGAWFERHLGPATDTA
jgi:putative phosphoribosyl transferase